VKFADIDKAPNSYMVSLDQQEKSIAFSPYGVEGVQAYPSESLDALSSMIVDSKNCVLYKSVYDGTDIVYEVRSSGIKEYIVINKPIEQNEFIYNLSLSGLEVKEIDNKIVFVDKNDQPLFVVEQLYAVDKKGISTKEVNCTLLKLNDSYQLKITIDKNFMDDNERIYPIVIDPSISHVVTGSQNTFDSYVSSKYPDTNYGLESYIRTGRDEDYYNRRTYIRFILPTWVTGNSVSSAYMRIEKYSGATPNIMAYRVLSSWSSSTITWNNKPSYSTTNASALGISDGGNWWRLNALTIVRSWLDKTYANNGFIIKDSNESGSTQWTTFYSSDAPSPHKPELHIIYNDNRFLSYGYGSSSVFVYPYGFNDVWQPLINQSRANWNNTATPILFSISSSSNNHIYANQYEWDDYARMIPESVSGSQLTKFSLQINARRINEDATNFENFVQSVCVHELGHTIWLNDNPICSLPSIMKYDRNRNSMTSPTDYDVDGVNIKY